MIKDPTIQVHKYLRIFQNSLFIVCLVSFLINHWPVFGWRPLWFTRYLSNNRNNLLAINDTSFSLSCFLLCLLPWVTHDDSYRVYEFSCITCFVSSLIKIFFWSNERKKNEKKTSSWVFLPLELKTEAVKNEGTDEQFFHLRYVQNSKINGTSW